MSADLFVQTDDFRVDIDSQGIAHLVFQPAGGTSLSFDASKAK
jgi:hypothetical protein